MENPHKPALYAKQPKTNPAIQFDGSRVCAEAIAAFADGFAFLEPYGIRVNTPSGWLVLEVGDWIVQGGPADFYPVKDDEFRRLYVPAPTDPVVLVPRREIRDHQVNPANDVLAIYVMDDAGAGGACHEYQVALPDGAATRISFQNGPIAEVGVNGLTHEVLLAIVADRLRSFQSGPFACRENALALTKVEEAQLWLQSRTLARMRRGVEGTHKA